ncbi:MAG: putative membrane channel-forming protein YqfA (hemolysin III family) [Verrucomicrobiales bacterium]|jgi:predicted membrane channel-forming protein YqfA (hemolysin III family)
MLTLLAETAADLEKLKFYNEAQPIAKIIHIIGAFMMIIGISALVMQKQGDSKKLPMMFHGIGMLVLFIAGIAWLVFASKLGQDYKMSQPWVLTKMIIWLIFGVSVVLAKKGIIFKGAVGWLAIIVLGGVAVAMAVLKVGAAG